jgi:hypothetical protein
MFRFGQHPSLTEHPHESVACRRTHPLDLRRVHAFAARTCGSHLRAVYQRSDEQRHLILAELRVESAHEFARARRIVGCE